MKLFIDLLSHDTSLGIETNLRARLPGSWGSTLGRDKYLFLLHNVQTGPGAHLASCVIVTGGTFPGSKTAGAS
jgi:hypothetical protein